MSIFVMTMALFGMVCLVGLLGMLLWLFIESLSHQVGEKDVSPEKHAEFIGNFASNYAQAKSNRIGLELKLKTAKAILMKQAYLDGITQVAAQERDALADPEYMGLIDDLMLAVKEEETLKYQLQASDLHIQIWRTREASERLAIRSHE